MDRYIWTDDGRILSSTDNEEFSEGMRLFSFPEDFDFTEQFNYRIIGEELVYDPQPKTDAEILYEKTRLRKEQLETAAIMFVRTNAVNLSDDEALSVSMLFKKWDPKGHFVKDDIYQYESNIYRCLQDHDGQETWPPDQAHSLWVRIRPEGEILEWEKVQPGINEPYSKGDKVTHNGKTWISDIDNNVWEPGIYGWSEVTD